MSIQYTISQIKTPQFAIFPEKFVNGRKANIQASISFTVPKDLHQIRCSLDIKYVQGEDLLMTTVIECYFTISPEGISTIKSEGKIEVGFLRYIGTISVGTARGVIAAKTENTVLNILVLPPINLVNMIKEDMVLPKENANASD